MGGTTQSKFAFISTTIKKKNEDLTKTKNTEPDKNTKVIFSVYTLIMLFYWTKQSFSKSKLIDI